MSASVHYQDGSPGPSECLEANATIEGLRAELAASESLVTALQEQMSRLAEQHAKAVAEAREEQRESDLRAFEAWLDPSGPMDPEGKRELIRATPLDSTPLAARIAELEVQLETASAFTQKSVLKELERFGLVGGAEFDAMKARAEAAESALAAEVERHQATAAALSELADIVEGALSEGALRDWAGIDSFTTKPARKALASLPAGPREDR